MSLNYKEWQLELHKNNFCYLSGKFWRIPFRNSQANCPAINTKQANCDTLPEIQAAPSAFAKLLLVPPCLFRYIKEAVEINHIELQIKSNSTHIWKTFLCEVTSLNSILQFKSYFKNWFGHTVTSLSWTFKRLSSNFSLTVGTVVKNLYSILTAVNCFLRPCRPK